MDEEDLVQEGYIGLLRAAKRFDDKGIRFSTCTLVGTRSMTRAIDHTGVRYDCPVVSGADTVLRKQ